MFFVGGSNRSEERGRSDAALFFRGNKKPRATLNDFVMKNILFTLFFVLIISAAASAQPASPEPAGSPLRVEPDAARGFAYPYYLFVAPELKADAALRSATHTMLVLPNNTGQLDDSLAFHEAYVKKRMAQVAEIAKQMKTAVLMPVFPRPKTDWRIYTHALDRDALLTDKKEYARFDRQLVAMIDDARGRLKKDGLKFDKKVHLNGFSASGMFANRFVFLHPERVKAAVVGSPGGWAIAPVAVFQGKRLRYPIGTADFKEVAGARFDLEKVRKVPLFIFLGDKDDNDSVIFGDSYEEEDKLLIFELFGKTPVDRWASTKALYEEAQLNAEFRLYPNVAHAVTAEIRQDIFDFLQKHAR